MPYFIRVLTPGDEQPDLRRIITEGAESCGRAVGIIVEQDSTTVTYADDDVPPEESDPIFVLERQEVSEGSLGEAELQEFQEEIEQASPASAVQWLREYLPIVKTIYSFQLFGPTPEDWKLVGQIHWDLHETVGGIIQADNEGFSNEEGCYILWQFSDNVTGSGNMAVLDQNDQWVSFAMDLGDREQRSAFCQGLVPSGVTLN